MTGAKPDENIRRPMQWSGGENAGFSGGRPWRQPDAGYIEANVAAQTDDSASLLWHYRALIALRNQHAALRVGDFHLVSADNPAIFASLRVSQDEAILVVVNLAAAPVTDYRLSLKNSRLEAGRYLILMLMGEIPSANLEVNGSGGFADFTMAEIPSYGTFVIQLQSSSQ